MSIAIEFPLVDVNTKFGIIPTPLITILVLTQFGYQPYQFLFDTGADFTMLPRHMAEDIGLNIRNLQKSRSYGIEDKDIEVYIGNVKVKIGPEELKIRCLISEKDTTPFLLGRIDVFPRFNITFDNSRKKISFIPIR